MLAKLTSKNRLTLPKAILSDFEGAEYFDVTGENGCIVLTPVRITRAPSWPSWACPRQTWPTPWLRRVEPNEPYPRSVSACPLRHDRASRRDNRCRFRIVQKESFGRQTH